MEVALRTSGERGTELQPTPTENTVPFRAADFSTLCEALDYAALGRTGCNFYGSRGDLWAVLSYADLREQAVSLARKLLSLKLGRGARVGPGAWVQSGAYVGAGAIIGASVRLSILQLPYSFMDRLVMEKPRFLWPLHN